MLIRHHKGAAISEYALITGLIGVVALGTTLAMGTSVSDTLTSAEGTITTASNTGTAPSGPGDTGDEDAAPREETFYNPMSNIPSAWGPTQGVIVGQQRKAAPNEMVAGPWDITPWRLSVICSYMFDGHQDFRTYNGTYEAIAYEVDPVPDATTLVAPQWGSTNGLYFGPEGDIARGRSTGTDTSFFLRLRTLECQETDTPIARP